MSVCMGVCVFVKVGLIDGLCVIMYYENIEELCEFVLVVVVMVDECFMDNGKICMLVGILVGIDLLLYVVVWLIG